MGRDGYIYVTEYVGLPVRRVSPAGQVDTLAGTGDFGDTDGDAAQATFGSPNSAAFDAAGNLLVSDSDNKRLRRISP